MRPWKGDYKSNMPATLRDAEPRTQAFYLITREGRTERNFDKSVAPCSPELMQTIESMLQAKG